MLMYSFTAIRRETGTIHSLQHESDVDQLASRLTRYMRGGYDFIVNIQVDGEFYKPVIYKFGDQVSFSSTFKLPEVVKDIFREWRFGASVF